MEWTRRQASMVRVHFLQRREKLEKKSTGVEKSEESK
jgi:hypothetical protein